jgi:3-oxoacyl-[acyl-carrier protein] reductase
MINFNGEVVLLTGSSGHIGTTTMDLFVKRGAKVICTSRSYPSTALQNIDFDVNPVNITLDITNEETVNKVFDLTIEKCGKLDVVVNIAGILNTKSILDLTEADWDKTLAVNVKGTFFICKAAMQQMIKQKSGCIINLASISGKVGGVLAGADYSSSKAAIICLTKSLAKAGAPYGIRVNSVAPGAIYSPMLDQYYEDNADKMAGYEADHPMGKFGEAIDVANSILFLASEESAYITGTCLDVNGGTLMS